MLLEIIRFELKYRLKRPATYLYFGILFLLTLVAMTSDFVQIGGAAGQVKINAPVTLANTILIITAFFSMIVSAIMGVGVLRDFEHKTHSMLFTTPITKRDYLFGRFIGSFIILIFVFSGAFFGMTLGYLKSFSEPDRFLAFNLWHYLQPFLLFGVTNLFISGTIMFAGGALSRKMLVVYTQGILLLVLYIVALQLSSSLEYKDIVAWLDPFGISAFRRQTEYWSIAEQNSQTAQLTGFVLYNRLLWLGIAIVSLFVLYKGFAFRVVRQSLFKPKAEIKTVATPIAITNLPKVKLNFGFGATIQHLFKLTTFYFKNLFKEVPFLAIVIAGMLMTFSASLEMNRLYGAYSFPTTYSVIELIQDNFTLFFLIIAVFYTGELVWKEREAKMDLIIDALPTQTWIGIISKFFALILSYSVLIVMLIFTGVLIQTFKGYYNYELGLYFKTMFSDTLSMLVIYTLLGLFIQVMVNNKFIGFATMIIIFIVDGLLQYMDVEHPLFHFGSGMNLGTYSDMNSFGHFVTPFSWMSAYWIMFSVALLFMAVYFSVRGTETNLKTRFTIGKYRINKTWIAGFMVSLVAVVFLGSFAFYNTNLLNEYKNSKQQEEVSVNYEKELKKYKDVELPKITAANLKVDIYPEDRDVTVEGYFTLKNKTNKPISDIHIQKGDRGNIKTEYLKFSKEVGLKENFKEFDYEIYTLAKPLQPNETVNLNFKMVLETEGFVTRGSNTNVVQNGTFFNNGFFPSLGYNESYEMGNEDKRKEYDLPEKERMPAREEEKFHSHNLFGNDADMIDFEIILSTSPDQIAISPGYLQKEWIENDRRYFHYKMDAPMANFYAMQSGIYEVMRDKWISKADTSGNKKEVALEIYYHEKHTANLDRMMNGMKDALGYFSENFGDYQHRQLRIIEFPRYNSFAQSFANTIPYSEEIGFMLDMESDDIDMNYYVTAHETAHQWWGHQVTEAPVQGSTMLSETLSQYSALMVMKHKYPKEMVQKFLIYELNSYLRGRNREKRKELPLDLVEGQQYIHYRKGSLVMYALQDYIGEEKINLALKNYLNKWKFSEGNYPTTTDLTNEIKAVTPDSLQYLITDLVESITFYENKTEKATYKDLGNDMYEVTLEFSSEKTKADSLGIETKMPLTEWIDIGVYGEEPTEKNAEGYKFAPLLYLEKHQITKENSTIKVKVKGKPVKAGIDPLNKLIDKHPDDNVQNVEKE
ncbi:aminopeptidase N [Bernardetia litoralis DSM 6794]|uniref:Aminopeptidase N n=1 Tax=Bernardetia litoralis (strain ATCC 23117 / DSM 6794 / NBRC 15988 / NCIMB 1366 / Fx l1 / Sio-4) TaxID=880071 RepID=I4AQ76_BERLS|nr:M1 family aminopeptidase [Bernardetia litoralis]AFM06111.1 aminopeptidase N [Bernardetia litoralis DSM 6794]